nr:reverse transcriptase domain-containing protein [Tanacetum cinerariifolium]
MGNVLVPRNAVKRVTTKGEKMTSEATPSKGDTDLMLPKSNFNDDEPWYADFANYIVEKDMDDLYITMKECIQLMTDKGHRRDQEFNWEIATHGTVFRMPLYPFNYPTMSLTMEEILTKFIDEVKRVTTKGEKMTSEATPSKGDKDLMLPKSNFNDDEPWAIKCILKRSVGYNPKNWLEKLDDALWAFRTTYKTATRCTPFRLVYGKACHLPIEIEHKAYWALKQCNMDLTLGSKSRLIQLNELAKLRDGAYENTRIYKERTKKWHNSRLHGDKDFKEGDKVLLYNSLMKMYHGKLKSK